MPFYDYVCSGCGRRTEVMHGIHAEGPTTCEVCGGALKKAMSPPAIVFRGTGWAKKERSTAARSASAKKDGDTSSTSDAGADASTGKEASTTKSSSESEGSASGKADPKPTSPSSSSTASSGT
jgi:putative FmdB family regulatory protein